MLMETIVAVNIPYLNCVDNQYPLEEISVILDKHERRHIRYAPWAAGGDLPTASFAIAYIKDNIYLKYYVTEPALKAEYNRFNDPVFEDSCVEFFIAFDDDPNYYNLEFNCLGNSLVQYGKNKMGRTYIPINILETIKHQTLIKNSAIGDICWELTLCIPKEIFKFHPDLLFEKSRARVNFFKCGDSLPEPHFLCWSEVEAPMPEFHLIEFFKEISFSPQI